MALFSSYMRRDVSFAGLFMYLCTMNINELHAHRRDAALDFDAGTHTYTVGGVVYDSVTTLVENCFEQFDAEYWAGRKATPGHTKEMILREWAAKGEAARNLGTLMHERIESYYLGQPVDSQWMSDPTFRIFAAFATDVRLCPYRTEWRIYHEESHLAGTLDFLALRSDGRLEIWDWKRSAKVVDSCGHVVYSNPYGKCALAPLEHLPDTSYYHYALQVSVYRYILAVKYGVETVAARLGVFHPDCGRYFVVDLPYLRDEVECLIASRSASAL